jgi:hypothetical protein
MRKLKKIDAACAVLALLYVSEKSEETVLRMCKLHGFKEGAGMSDAEWGAAAKLLGVSARAIPLEACPLRKFIKDHKTGLFLVGTCDHLFVVDDGVIVDPRHPTPPGLRRTIRQAWRVDNDKV